MGSKSNVRKLICSVLFTQGLLFAYWPPGLGPKIVFFRSHWPVWPQSRLPAALTDLTFTGSKAAHRRLPSCLMLWGKYREPLNCAERTWYDIDIEIWKVYVTVVTYNADDTMAAMYSVTDVIWDKLFNDHLLFVFIVCICIYICALYFIALYDI